MFSYRGGRREGRPGGVGRRGDGRRRGGRGSQRRVGLEGVRQDGDEELLALLGAVLEVDGEQAAGDRVDVVHLDGLGAVGADLGTAGDGVDGVAGAARGALVLHLDAQRLIGGVHERHDQGAGLAVVRDDHRVADGEIADRRADSVARVVDLARRLRGDEVAAGGSEGDADRENDGCSDTRLHRNLQIVGPARPGQGDFTVHEPTPG
ncbi:hypothetical protein C5B98_00005 [Rathayibacter sp. AY1A5]|nr:hypothetical protein C5B98_00005 [Rathayibacter sp. AY1A5]